MVENVDVGDILDLADRLWRGEARIEDHHPFSSNGPIEEVAEGVAFFPSFANVSGFRTGDGLVLVDTGSPATAGLVHQAVRSWAGERLHTAVYSHGHIDHVFGVPPFEAEAAERGWPMPRVVGHEAVAARFDRYRASAGWNTSVNRRQFGIPGLRWPTQYRYPDETYREHLTVEVGGRSFELHHARGETDDHTWTWAADRRILCSGDLFIWASPNAGNPQKVQRYPREWALALRRMAQHGAELLLPGHGLPILGADRVHQALSETAELLEALHDQALEMMNGGARLDDLLGGVRAPAALLERPYLRPIYDEPEFVVRNVWRQYGGWYDGNPAHLKPAGESALAAEVAALAGGAGPLAARARQLAEDGGDAELRLAGHLIEWAVAAAPEDREVHRARAEIYERRRTAATSTMAKGVFTAAARESRDWEPG
ncbi:MAG: alkyl sulfatase dimerization domain-containing protein [Acidimicrobiales bacterium]